MPGSSPPSSNNPVDAPQEDTIITSAGGPSEHYIIHTGRAEHRDQNTSHIDVEAQPGTLVKEVIKGYGSIDADGTKNVEPTSNAPAEASALNRAVIAITLVSIYIAVSASMICFNKFLMAADRFPFAAQLTTLHMLTAWFLASSLRAVTPAFFPSASTVFGDKGDPLHDNSLFATHLQQAKPFVPLACCGAVSLVCGNAAYKYASVAFLQMVKESHIVFVYGLMVMYGLDKLRLRNVIVISCVGVCAALAVYGEVHFSFMGLSLQMVAGFAGSLQIVLTNKLMSQSKGPKIDPMTMVLCTAPVMLVLLIPVNIASWNPVILERALQFWRFLALNALLAFALQVVTAVAIRQISGTGHALGSILKDLTIVLAASLIMHEHLATLQYVGFAGSVSGIFLYSLMKLCPHWFETAASAAENAKDDVAIAK